MNATVQVHSLASGSSGNAMLAQCDGTSILIDAGLPLRTLSSALMKRGVGAGGLDAILLTHEHSDHSAGAGPVSRRTGAPVVANLPTLEAYAERDAISFATRVFGDTDELQIGAFRVCSFPVPHDAASPVGFVLEAGGTRFTYFTDAGSVTAEMRDAVRNCSLAIVESNHDIDWLWRGTYTPEMKARVASPTGHLSNDDCADFVAELLERDGPLTVWLAHLSRANNSPTLARRSVAARISRQTAVPFVLQVALRDHPSVQWRSGSESVQLALL